MNDELVARHRAITPRPAGRRFKATRTTPPRPATAKAALELRGTNGQLPLAEGRVAFIRRVSVVGTVTLLSQSFRVGKRHRGLYLRMVVHTGHGSLTAYLNGRVPKRWPCTLLNVYPTLISRPLSVAGNTDRVDAVPKALPSKLNDALSVRNKGGKMNWTRNVDLAAFGPEITAFSSEATANRQGI